MSTQQRRRRVVYSPKACEECGRETPVLLYVRRTIRTPGFANVVGPHKWMCWRCAPTEVADADRNPHGAP